MKPKLPGMKREPLGTTRTPDSGTWRPVTTRLGRLAIPTWQAGGWNRRSHCGHTVSVTFSTSVETGGGIENQFSRSGAVDTDRSHTPLSMCSGRRGERVVTGHGEWTMNSNKTYILGWDGRHIEHIDRGVWVCRF